MKPLVIKRKLRQETGAKQEAPKLKSVEELRKEWLQDLARTKQQDNKILANWRAL